MKYLIKFILINLLIINVLPAGADTINDNLYTTVRWADANNFNFYTAINNVAAINHKHNTAANGAAVINDYLNISASGIAANKVKLNTAAGFNEGNPDDPENIMISGKVTYFNGDPVDSALVEVKNKDFSPAFSTHTDKNGNYSLQVKKGKYLGLLAIRMDEYPRSSSLPAEEQKLEFWAWNFIADNDTLINMQYHRLEIYGLNAFRIYGSYPGYTIYCRPMSLGRLHEGKSDLAPEPEELDITVEINGTAVKLNMKQKVREFVPGDELYGYLLHVDLPDEKTVKAYDIFRIKMKNMSNGDTGEALLYKERFVY